MQMECVGVDECEFVEFQFKNVYYSEWYNFKKTKGIFACYDDGRIEEWTGEPGTIEGGTLFYWILSDISRDLVERDPKWLETHFQKLDDFWKEVVRHREAGTIPDKEGVLKVII
jgi:hypothetical protein